MNSITITARAIRDKFPLNGGYPVRLVELYHGKIIPMQHYEPDPNTSRDEYYYNTVSNILYQLLHVPTGGVWKPVSR